MSAAAKPIELADHRKEKLSAERAYLACVLCDQRVLDQHVPAIAAIHDRRNRRVLEAAIDIHAAGGTVDSVTIRGWLTDRQLYAEVGDNHLLSLTSEPPSLAAVRSYVEIIASDHRTRLVRDTVRKHDAALRSGDPAVAHALTSDLEAILAAELDEGPLAGGTWVRDLGEDPIGVSPPARRWLLRMQQPNGTSLPWLPRGIAGMLASAGGVGKTFLAIQLALCVATGRRWLDSISIPEPGPVALVLAEEERDEVIRRMHYAAEALGLTREERDRAASMIWLQCRAGKRSALLEADQDGNLRESDFMRALRRYLRSANREWALVVIDPIARLSPPEAERDNQIATLVVSTIESLMQVPGSPTVLALHHTSKTMRDGRKLDASSARGVTAFNDGFRWSCTLGPATNRKRKVVDNYWELSVAKSNYGPSMAPLILTRDMHSNGVLRVADEAELDEVGDYGGGE